MISRFVFLTFAALAPLVSAHGHMSGVFVDDKYVPGPEPNSGSTGFAIREINDIDPVKGANNSDINCGHGATTASEVVDASGGSVLKFAWVNGDGGPWVHNTGPVMTYMASCGSGGCANFDSANAQFFKISELGKKDDGSWYMSDLNAALNDTTSATIPSDLPAGEYLVRHELIAMQLGMSPGGAEFYPACLQIRLSGNNSTVSATSLPSGTQTVTFPGGYSDTDPGILDVHIYDPGYNYTFPGPALISTSTDGTGSSGDTPTNTGSDTPTTSDTPTSSTGATPMPTGCGYANKKKKRVVKRVYRRNPLVKKSTTPAQQREVENHIPDYKRSNHAQPVVRSRIMRGI